MSGKARRLGWMAGAALLATGCATLPAPVTGSGGPGPGEVPIGGGLASVGHWPDDSAGDEALLAPFLACATPAEFVDLQRGVDMPRLVGALKDWSAVRLGAMGPLLGGADLLARKRASFLVDAAERYGALAEVFALYVIHATADDELRAVLGLLAKDKQLQETLGHMSAVRAELERRDLRLSGFPERGEQPGDVGRGLGRAARDMLSSSPGSDGARFMEAHSRSLQMPPPYQQAFTALFDALAVAHFEPGHAALGFFDHLTFGVPLGAYYLAAGTAGGVSSLAKGEYERATRQLAPAALLVATYAGGKGVRAYQAHGAGLGMRLQAALELRMAALGEVAARLRERLGENGLRQLARYIQAQREAAVLVAAGGEPAALALYEAKGDVGRAKLMMAKAEPAPSQPMAGAGKAPRSGRALGGVASLVDEAAGLTAEVVEAKLLQVELESGGARLPADVALLEQQRPRLDAPPPGVAADSVLWKDYVAYRERRLNELKAGKKAEGPLRWDGYGQMWGQFRRGIVFQHAMVELLRADAKLRRPQRRWLRDFEEPQVETNVGVAKADLRYADVMVIEKARRAPRRVESFSFKSRDFSRTTDPKQVAAQMKADAAAARRFYGETLDIRRPSLKHLGPRVQIDRVRLVYEGGALKPDPKFLPGILNDVQGSVAGVEVSVQ